MNLCLLTGLYKSKGEASRDIVGGGIYLNGDRIDDPQYTLCEGDLLYDKYILFRKGKNTIRIMELKYTCDINEKEVLYETEKKFTKI